MHYFRPSPHQKKSEAGQACPDTETFTHSPVQHHLDSLNARFQSLRDGKVVDYISELPIADPGLARMRSQLVQNLAVGLAAKLRSANLEIESLS